MFFKKLHFMKIFLKRAPFCKFLEFKLDYREYTVLSESRCALIKVVGSQLKEP
jgi:hypothetical protein